MNALAIAGGLALAAAAAWSAHALRAPRAYLAAAAALGLLGAATQESLAAALGLALVLLASRLAQPFLLFAAPLALLLPGGALAVGLAGAVWTATMPWRRVALSLLFPLPAALLAGPLAGALVAAALLLGLVMRTPGRGTGEAAAVLATLAGPLALLLVASRAGSPPLGTLRAGILALLAAAALALAWRGSRLLRLADGAAAARMATTAVAGGTLAAGLAVLAGSATPLAVVPGLAAGLALLGSRGMRLSDRAESPTFRKPERKKG